MFVVEPPFSFATCNVGDIARRCVTCSSERIGLRLRSPRGTPVRCQEVRSGVCFLRFIPFSLGGGCRWKIENDVGAFSVVCGRINNRKLEGKDPLCFDASGIPIN